MRNEMRKKIGCSNCIEKTSNSLSENEVITSMYCSECNIKIYASHYQRLDIALSEVCNLHCNMCRRPQEKKSIDFSAIKRFLNEAKSIGVRLISFSGGEPFVYPQFREVLAMAIDLDFEIELVTNGTLLKKSDIALLEKLQCVTVSIDGPQVIHDMIRGHNGA